MPTDLSALNAMSEIAGDMFRRSGINLDYQATDWGSAATRVMTNRDGLDKGGWSAWCNYIPGIIALNPATQSYVRGPGKTGTSGWPDLPKNAPHICATLPDPMTPLRYDFKEWSYANGFSYFYAATGWAQYDRHFAVWAEREGYALDTISQTDLHLRPELLDGYSCVVIVGHDGYWTREMRLAMEDYVDRGGQARLPLYAANNQDRP